ncbi:hypothetical protein F4820DRAFT_454255 [Hypoxylon rubiginosum]|uniref:Uncharacterized protein n=1 Tax=Hypoxylon rubiginosum TaxID=110542 RepID=A0ACB9YI62_9PEZI|nr:hypothetical protein F4820DRAFT_454255 [Hypoxylon rubiginosum]
MSSSIIPTVTSSDTPSGVLATRDIMTTLSTVVKRVAVVTVVEPLPTPTPTPTTSSMMSEGALAGIIVGSVAFLLLAGFAIMCVCGRICQRQRARKKETQGARAAGGNPAGDPAGGSGGSLEVMEEGDDGQFGQVRSHTSHTSRVGRASHSQAPPRGARHAGATGATSGLTTMSSSGGGGGGAGSHH